MKLLALEKNILKYRALEMTLILFHSESLKRFIINSIRATSPKRLPVGTKNVVKRAFDILVQDGILTQEENVELQDLIDYRNDIAHRIYLLTRDITHPRKPKDHLKEMQLKYRYDALGKFEHYRRKIVQGLQYRYVLSLSLDTVFFENVEKTYKEELERLRKRIDRQFDIRERQIASQRASIKR